MAVPYLVAHPPARRQFRQRYARLTGLIVVHTAESAPDTVGPDDGVDNVAAFIRRRADPGSYHTLCDSDDRRQLVPYDQAAYGDGTGSNEFAIHISAATQAHRWLTLSKAWREGCVRQMAEAAADAARWLLAEHGITVPARRVTRAESDRGVPGFISHGERDPGRRTDPGPAFPWDLFLTTYADLMEDEDMPKYRDWDDADKKALANDIADAVLARDVDPGKPKLSVRQALRQAANAPGLVRALGRAQGHDVDKP